MMLLLFIIFFGKHRCPQFGGVFYRKRRSIGEKEGDWKTIFMCVCMISIQNFSPKLS